MQHNHMLLGISSLIALPNHNKVNPRTAKLVPFSIATENVELMQECCHKYLLT